MRRLVLLGVAGWTGHNLAAISSSDWTSYLLNGGPFAIVLFLLVKDYLTTPYERDRLRIENDALRQEISVLNQNVREEIVPAVVRMNDLMVKVIDTLRDLEPRRRS